MVISLLISSLSPDIAKSVQYSKIAESIWKQLNNRYGTINGTKVFEIKRELASTYQGTLDIVSYFNKLKKLWDKLGVMCTSHANSCVCAAKEGLQMEKEEDRVHQFLMGLNEIPFSTLIYKTIYTKVNFDSSNQKSNATLSCKYCKKPGHTIEKCYKLHGFPPNFKFTKGKKFGTAASGGGQTSEPFAMYSPIDQSSLIPGLTKE
ncbi:uncharacterized protein LOC142162211 [Nicotiana tabacum]|uniref:Uncharacterized protein LOC142162211 n=1 Tax=Nicotiana tabacum TaxID=4097 RepID=A0AC58RPL4_TOBAC